MSSARSSQPHAERDVTPLPLLMPKEAGALSPEAVQWLNTLMTDEGVSDIMINRYDRVFVERNGVLMEGGFHFPSAEAVQALAELLIKLCAKEKMAAVSPVVDAMLPGGSRLSIIQPPVAVEGHSISIRKFPSTPLTFGHMVERKLMPAAVAAFLKTLARNRASVIVTGGTSSGKTTLLNALSFHVSPTERVITIEDTPELQLQLPNIVRLEMTCLGSNQGCSARDLVKAALRTRPDRIIMGEIRGPEAFELMQAINTGHEGSMATIHANSPRDAFTRLEHMVTMAGTNLTSKAIRQQICAAIDVFIQLRRDEGGKRRISHITEAVGMEGETLVANDIFTYDFNKEKYEFHSGSSRNPKLQAAIEAAKSAK